jgi:hypothetical protein
MDASLPTIGIREQDKDRKSFILYPNPSVGEESINMPVSSEKGIVEVFNTMRMLAFRRILNEGEVRHFNFSQLEKGLYVMMVTQAGEVSCR